MQLQIGIGSYLAFQEVPWSNWSGYDTRNIQSLTWDPFAKNNALLSANVGSPSCYEGRAYPLEVIRPVCEMDLWEKTGYLTVCWREVRVCRLKRPHIPSVSLVLYEKQPFCLRPSRDHRFEFLTKALCLCGQDGAIREQRLSSPFASAPFLYRQVRLSPRFPNFLSQSVWKSKQTALASRIHFKSDAPCC